MNNIRVDTDLLPLLPFWYQGVEEYREILNAESETYQGVLEDLKQVHKNLFFLYMDESTVLEWEQIFGIISDPSEESLDFRRDRILNRMSTKPPFTIRTLQAKLDELIGPGNYNLIVDGANYTIIVESSASNQAYAIEVSYTINQLKPAHILYINKPYLKTGLIFNETISYSKTKYNYQLGAWGLGLEPFAESSGEQVIKLPTTYTAKADFLEDVATAIAGIVTKARLNGTVVISSVTASASDDTCTVEYSVAPTDTALISKVELLDASDNVLTEASVYVPVTETITMKHVIPVSEGVSE